MGEWKNHSGAEHKHSRYKCKCRLCLWCECGSGRYESTRKARIRRWRQDRDTQRVELLDIAERKG